jgi:hypothetical protein
MFKLGSCNGAANTLRAVLYVAAGPGLDDRLDVLGRDRGIRYFLEQLGRDQAKVEEQH